MGLNILAWSNAINQQSGYGICQKHLLPRIDTKSNHSVVQLACSGLKRAPPTTLEGVKVYPKSNYGGELGEQDIEHVVQRENIDIILIHLDAWAIADSMKQLGESPNVPPIVMYAPIDHNGPEYMPGSALWRPVFDVTERIVPFCEFGERVLREDGVSEDLIADPILHGVDPDIFQPGTGEDPKGLDEKEFVVGFFKALQGTRGGHERVLRTFRNFLDAEDAWDDAFLYVHCAQYGKNAFDLPTLIAEFDLTENVLLPSPSEYRWFADDDRMGKLYSGCDVVLNTARGEGFGLPVLEAMACETPVIAGAYSSMPELVLGEEGEITHEEVDVNVVDAPRGWLIPTWDERMTIGKHNYRRRYQPDHILSALQTAYHNPEIREKKGKRGREFALEHTWSDKADQFIDLFDRLDDELWETDDTTGIQWETIGAEGAEHGGVGGLGRGVDPS